MLFAGLVLDEEGTRKCFNHTSALVEDSFSLKVLVGKIIVIGMDSNHGTFENRTVFFESLDVRE